MLPCLSLCIAGIFRRSRARRPARSASRRTAARRTATTGGLRSGFRRCRACPSPRRPALAGPVWLIRALEGLTSLGGRGRNGRALAPRCHRRGVEEDQRVSSALEGGVAIPVGVVLVALVHLPARPFVPVASGAAGPHNPPGPVRRAILAADSNPTRARRPDGARFPSEEAPGRPPSSSAWSNSRRVPGAASRRLAGRMAAERRLRGDH